MKNQIFVISKNEEEKLLSIERNDNIENIVLVGLGASVLNTRAIMPCVALKKKIICIDSIDSEQIDNLISRLTPQNTLIVAISKSGNTDETILILKYILSGILKNCTSYLVSENKDSPFVKQGFNLTENAIFYKYESSPSGRFSVLLSASMLPLHLAGADIAPIASDARNFSDENNAIDFAENLLKSYKLNRNIFVISVYDNKLLGFAEWVRQIVAESLGKNGFGPTTLISRGTIDEHSQLQLYLDGPDDKTYYMLPFLNLRISNSEADNLLKESMQNHLYGFNKSINEAGKPCILEEDFGVNTICKWLVAIQHLAFTQNINPFSQPAVDKAKSFFVKIKN